MLQVRQIRMRLAVLALGVGIAVLAGCGPSQTAGQPGGALTGAKPIMIKGSDTMVHLVTAWVDGFKKSHPGVAISVTGGGSGTGIAALLNGTTDICASSRDLSEQEKSSAGAKNLHLVEAAVARDALSIIVHPGNSIGELTMDQLRAIFTGSVANWKDVGGPDLGIVPVSRETSSGTYMFFLEHVLKKQDFAPNVLLLPATSAITQTVADSQGAIGYVGLGYAVEAGGKVKMIGVKESPEAPAVMPSTESVLAGSYPISRPLLLVVGQEPAGTVKEFIDFCLSPEGQAIVETSGYVKVQ